MSFSEEKPLSKQEFVESCSAFERKCAIYTEGSKVLQVQVSDISCNDWGVRANVGDLLTPGMHRATCSPFEIACRWDVFYSSTDYWKASFVVWRLYFDPTLVRACAELASQASQNGSTIQSRDVEEAIYSYRFLGRQFLPAAAKMQDLPDPNIAGVRSNASKPFESSASSPEAPTPVDRIVSELSALVGRLWQRPYGEEQFELPYEEWLVWRALLARIRELDQQQTKYIWDQFSVA